MESREDYDSDTTSVSSERPVRSVTRDLARFNVQPAGTYSQNIPGVGSFTGTRPGPSRQQKTNSKSDKMLRSPFGVFMTEQRPLLENDGVTFPQGWKSVADYLNPKWAMMSEKEQAYYREKSIEIRGCGGGSVNFKAQPQPQPQDQDHVQAQAQAQAQKVVDTMNAKIEKSLSRGIRPLGFTTFGERIVTIHDEVMVEYREFYAMRAKIEAFLHLNLGQQPKAIKEKTCVVVEFTPYCMDTDGTGDIVPGEWAMAAFSIKKGLISVSSGLIDPGTVPLGTASEVKDSIRTMGLQPVGISEEPQDFQFSAEDGEIRGRTVDPEIEKEQLLNSPDDRFLAVVNEISDMLMLWHRDSYKPGYIFTMKDNVQVVKRCLKWLYKKSGKKLEVEVFSLAALMEMFSEYSISGTNMKRTEVESDRFLKRVIFAYEESLSCDWHLAPERMNLLDKCARNVVQRVIYNLLDYLCPAYDVEGTVPEHSPIEHRENVHDRRWFTTLPEGYFDTASVYSLGTEGSWECGSCISDSVEPSVSGSAVKEPVQPPPAPSSSSNYSAFSIGTSTTEGTTTTESTDTTQ